MIDDAELTAWSARFSGVASEQILRDHLLSHLLAGLRQPPEDFAFIGGTALTRTALPDSRLSEDIDLLVASPTGSLPWVERVVAHPELLREYPELSLTWTRRAGDLFEAAINHPGRASARLQLVRRQRSHDALEYESKTVELRYSDLPESVELVVPTAASFAAMKGMAFHDRHAPRDLFDLSGLARAGLLSRDADQLMRRATNHGFIAIEFERLNRALVGAWETELAHQTGALPSARSCADDVLRAIGSWDGEA